MGGIPEESMAPSPATTEAAMPSPSLACPSLPAQSTPSPPTTTGGGATAAEHRATTTLQCWKRHIWLSCWFAQQAEQCQRCLRLRSLCRGASAYAMPVWGNCQPPPTPTNKTSNPKVLRHPFRDHGLPLPQRRWAQQNNCPRCCLGRRYWPRALGSGGGLLCMPLCFWAMQTAVAALGHFVRAGRSNLTPYLPFDCSVKSAYKQYIHLTKKEFNVNSICNGLDYFHQKCDNMHIRMDVESELLFGALDVLAWLYDTG
jgi:hypothetical protein